MESKTAADAGTVMMLDADHRQVFEQALIRILQTDIAEETYAEIIDGMPKSATWRALNHNFNGHPAMDHPELCPGSLDKAREFRANFAVGTLEFPLVPLLAFDESDFGSKSFHLRLIELLARACHQIACQLYQITGHNDHHTEHEQWRDEPREPKPWDTYRAPIAFMHEYYDAVDQYPNGLGDVVGYWAETKIFGGVIVFDRGENDNECKDVYIHGCGRSAPMTIFPPTEEQFDQLVQFFVNKTEGIEQNSCASRAGSSPCPLPIVATMDNRWRWDPWDAFVKFHIFRDRHERREPDIKPDLGRPRTTDWPELRDQLLISCRLIDKRDGLPVDEAEVEKFKKGIRMITPSSPLWESQTEPPSPTYVTMQDPDTGEYSVQKLSDVSPFSYEF